MTRADLLVLEVMIHLAEGYRCRYQRRINPPQQQVLREFLRVELAQVTQEPNAESRDLLETALTHLESLSQQPALLTDRLLAATAAQARDQLAGADGEPDGEE